MILQTFHIIISIFILFYNNLFRFILCENLYVLLIFIKLIHWTLFNGECIFSYIDKKIKNDKYEPGQDLHKKDIKNKYLEIARPFMYIWLTFNLNKIFIRLNVPKESSYLFIFIYLSYLTSLEIFENHNINKNFQRLNHLTQTIMLLWFIFSFNFIFY